VTGPAGQHSSRGAERRTIALDDHLTVNSLCRTVLTAGETSQGPRVAKPGETTWWQRRRYPVLMR
jgi:hypothetical protein